MLNLSGLTLATLMQRELDGDQNIILMLQILDGLCALHKHKMSHRDIIPTNALISSHFRCWLISPKLRPGQFETQYTTTHIKVRNSWQIVLTISIEIYLHLKI